MDCLLLVIRIFHCLGQLDLFRTLLWRPMIGNRATIVLTLFLGQVITSAWPINRLSDLASYEDKNLWSCLEWLAIRSEYSPPRVDVGRAVPGNYQTDSASSDYWDVVIPLAYIYSCRLSITPPAVYNDPNPVWTWKIIGYVDINCEVFACLSNNSVWDNSVRLWWVLCTFYF